MKNSFNKHTQISNSIALFNIFSFEFKIKLENSDMSKIRKLKMAAFFPEITKEC